ncbi:hypothetical protein [Neorhizobium alkalisoli]|uniref:Uncharacterized protein n=1 Tax=Neorhizobium alkalisoli TaxID=528178 RepID=A0A561QPE4_9HYPH|nr:hypothetical protein [Neorhizobium alkalisoli]TWF52172.1 hypothetical protein FHW37_105271 [Neorhizobium alkalisoli]
MQHLFRMLKSRFAIGGPNKTFASARPEELQVVVPDAVILPLPKSPREEISVPASINGRDLSTGRL